MKATINKAKRVIKKLVTKQPPVLERSFAEREILFVNEFNQLEAKYGVGIRLATTDKLVAVQTEDIN